MGEDASPVTRYESHEKWNQARRKAFLTRLYNTLGITRRSPSLLSFEEVQEKLRLNQNAYRGLQEVPLDQIVGSVGRYNDFTRTFLPLIEGDSWRWRRVAELQSEAGLPPIELYRVGAAYFVKDGNHRVSVARQYGAKTIEAYVWEYETPVGGLSADAEVDDLIVKAEYRAFLDRTRLDVTHPEQKIVLTEPGMYPELEMEIELYRRNLEQIDSESRNYREGAAAWYDMAYTLGVDMIRESGVLDLFPGRTESDLYVWVTRHRKELSEQYGEHVSLRDAVAQLAEAQHKPGTVERMIRSVVGLVHSQPPETPVVVDVDLPESPTEDEPLGKLLVQMHSAQPEMAYSGERGDDWRAWRQTVRDKVRELLGMNYVPAEAEEVEIVDEALISGVKRQKIYLTAVDGLEIPAYVMRPVDMDGPAPALLVYPGHGTIDDTAGLQNSAHCANALALAQAGYVTITVEERGMGELGQVDHLALDNVARLMGRTWLGITIEDALRALDYLQSRPDVKPTHLGITGLGLGGGLALYTAALDERIRSIVIQNYLGGDILPMMVLGHGCDFVPSLRRYVELSDVARLIVPRPALYAYPKGRATTAAAHAVFDRMRPSYEVFRCPDRTRFYEHDKGGDYDGEIAQSWFDRWLMDEEDTSVLLWAPKE